MPSLHVNRKLAAIMFTDIVGFTKIMGDDETTALTILENQQSLINPIVEEHKGTIIKKMGDGLLIEFPSTVEAVECATQMQESIKSYNSSDENIEFHIRIGIHLGDIVILGDDILGDGVNIASRIEPLASPDGICITDAVYQSVKSTLKLDAERIDEVDLKHIDDKYTIYKLPKNSDKEAEYQQTNEIDITRFEINSIENKTNLLAEIKKMYLFWFCCMLLSCVIAFYITGDSWKEALSFISSFSGLSLVVITALLFWFPFSGRIYKLNFQDIRNVSSLLDILIMKMQFTLVKQTGNLIEYIHTPATDMFINKIKFTRYYPKILKRYDTLRVTFDGNTVELVGLYFHLFRLLRNLKKFYK